MLAPAGCTPRNLADAGFPNVGWSVPRWLGDPVSDARGDAVGLRQAADIVANWRFAYDIAANPKVGALFAVVPGGVRGVADSRFAKAVP